MPCPALHSPRHIIVGFPFETEEDFTQTMPLLKSLRLDIVHYSRYYARPHTVAAQFPQLPMRVVKPRVKELSDWFKGLRPYDGLVGQALLCVGVGRGGGRESVLPHEELHQGGKGDGLLG